MKVIYKILSPTNKVYIGQSMEFEKRYKFYQRGHAKQQTKLHNSFVKHGFETHSFEIIHELPDDVSQQVFDNYESFYMQSYKDCGVELLNLRDGGTNGACSDETKRKMSESKKGMVPYNKGIPHSEAHKQKLKEARARRAPFSQETRKKISDFHKGKPKSEAAKKKLSDHFKGFKHSDEAKLKMSKAGKGRKFTDEHRKRISKALSGIKKSAEHIAKRVASIRARTGPRKDWSEEAKKKQSEKAKLIHLNKKLNGL